MVSKKPLLARLIIWYKPKHDKTNKMTCAPSEDSDQPQCIVKEPRFLHSDSEDSDQTGQMPKLIWVFAGCTGHFVAFVMLQLICWSLSNKEKKNEPAHEIMALFIPSNMHAQPSSGARCLIFLSDPLSTSILHMCEHRRLWRDCANVQARLSLRWSPIHKYMYQNLMSWLKWCLFVCLCWGLTSQSTIFQSCRDGATASWVINQYFRGVKYLAQGHNTAAVGFEPPTSRSGVQHSTTEPPRSPLK